MNPLFDFLCVVFVMCVLCCNSPITETRNDTLELQHQLSKSIDSIDSLWELCKSPEGCTCRNGVVDCPDVKPPELPK